MSLLLRLVYGADSPVVKREAADDGHQPNVPIPSYTFPEVDADQPGPLPDDDVPVSPPAVRLVCMQHRLWRSVRTAYASAAAQ